MEYLIGADPEIFVANQEGVVVSGIDLIPGDKDNPHPITEDGHSIQVDNVAWEFNIPPSDSVKAFTYNINYVLDYLSKEAEKHGLKLSNLASYKLAKEELTHPTAQRFGCEPDFNAYTGDFNEAPDTNTQLRVVGGHIHFGYPDPNVASSILIVKLFDLFVTLYGVVRDPDTQRRQLYGKPGSFRFKDFGVECRALSNFWLHNQEDMEYVYNASIKVVKLAIEQPEESEKLVELYSEQVLDAINTNNVEKAKELLEKLNKN